MFRAKLVVIVIWLSILQFPSVANAEEYATATEARTAAVQAMKDFQSINAECKNINNPKNSLSAAELAGIKIILERAKTLLDDCAVSDKFAEKSIAELTADTGSSPKYSIDEYSDYVMEFEAYSSTLDSIMDDLREALPTLKELGLLIGNRGQELTDFEQHISKFDAVYSGLTAANKSSISSADAWGGFQNFKLTLTTEKDNYAKAMANLDELNRLIDLEDSLSEITGLFSIKLPLAELDKTIVELNTLVTPKKSAVTKNTTITCVKGKTVKKVTAAKPTCPAGFKKR